MLDESLRTTNGNDAGAGESTAGESTAGESTAGESTAGESTRVAGAHAAAGSRRTGFRTDVAPWIVVAMLATAILALRPPAWVSAPVALVAGVAVVERLARHRRRGLLDGVLVGLGGSFAAVGLLGVALDVSPVGLTFAGWLVGLATLSIAALTACAGRAKPAHLLTGVERRITAATVAVGFVTAAIVAAALVLSLYTTAVSQVAPLQMTATVKDAEAAIAITSGTDSGPFDLVTVVDGQRTPVAADLRVGPAGGVQLTITLPTGQHTVMQLLNPGESVPMREIVVQTGPTTGGS